ncbi:MAG: type II toxin-antitoxin system HicA family toxin [Chloroflexota bacterium]
MTPLPSASGKQVVQALLHAGFHLSHVRGSHRYLRKSDDPAFVVVPVHGSRDLPVGTLRSIIRQANLTVEEFTRLLRQ